MLYECAEVFVIDQCHCHWRCEAHENWFIDKMLENFAVF